MKNTESTAPFGIFKNKAQADALTERLKTKSFKPSDINTSEIKNSTNNNADFEDEELEMEDDFERKVSSKNSTQRVTTGSLK